MNSTEPKYRKDFLERAHQGCIYNKDEILQSELCGCFFCCETFLPAEIIEWIIELNKKGETAVCPKCTFDSVLSSQYPVSDKIFLEEMHKFYF